jgi:hypothetical protein
VPPFPRGALARSPLIRGWPRAPPLARRLRRNVILALRRPIRFLRYSSIRRRGSVSILRPHIRRTQEALKYPLPLRWFEIPATLRWETSTIYFDNILGVFLRFRSSAQETDGRRGEALYRLGFSLHAIQDLAAHKGMTNVEHSFRDRRSETNPDFDAVSYATAQQWTDEFLNLVKEALGGDWVCLSRYDGPMPSEAEPDVVGTPGKERTAVGIPQPLQGVSRRRKRHPMELAGPQIRGFGRCARGSEDRQVYV